MQSNSNQVFYNTTCLKGDELLEQTQKALSLQELIFELFKCDPHKKTPFEVSTVLLKNGYKHPIWSIRRALTNLTKESKLLKSQHADVLGDYKAKNHTWTLSAFYLNSEKNFKLFPNIRKDGK